jgi:hypothetical protein
MRRLVLFLLPAAAQAAAPPWTDADDVPLPAWAQSVEPKKGDMIIYEGPSRASSRRGLSVLGARLPLFAAKRGAGCGGRWLQVGPLAWVCSDNADLSSDDPSQTGMHAGSDGLPFQYFFVGRDGASAYGSLHSAGDAAPDRELERGWAVAILEQRQANGDRWGKTNRNDWVSMRDIYPARPSTFHGEPVNGSLEIAWVLPDRATVFAAPSGRATGSRVRFQLVGYKEEKGLFARIGEDEWMLKTDLAHPTLAPPPEEVKQPGERWLDVHLASQTVVAYEGARPVYATLVSTGRGPRGSDSATPPGVHRIWVKINTSTMDNVEREDLSKHYSMEDVPYVQFFAKAVALHGAFWHNGFGKVRSHGCVNLTPLDSKWLFGFTSPKVPPGWHAA